MPTSRAFSIAARIAWTVGIGPSPRSASMNSTAGDSLTMRTSGRGFIQPLSMKSRYCGIRCTPCESTPAKVRPDEDLGLGRGIRGGHPRPLECPARERLERFPVDRDFRHRCILPRVRPCPGPPAGGPADIVSKAVDPPPPRGEDEAAVHGDRFGPAPNRERRSGRRRGRARRTPAGHPGHGPDGNGLKGAIVPRMPSSVTSPSRTGTTPDEASAPSTSTRM